MILHPWILGLIVGHVALLLVFSLGIVNAWQIRRGWDGDSTEEKQFLLEKKTYLVSTAMNFAMGTQILMLFLFVLAANELAEVLPGAMCAVGTLSSNSYGFPVLYVNIVSFFVCFMWLTSNHLDNQMETFPLVRQKYFALILIYPLVLAETALLVLFALSLDPSVITSCCGSVYKKGGEGLGASLAAASAGAILPLFFLLVLLLVLHRGLRWSAARQWWGNPLRIPLWAAFFVAAIIVIISFISTYAYEMLSHNCPFCFIAAEYHFYGVPLYFSLFTATATGMAGGLLGYIRQPEELKNRALRLQATMERISLWAMAVFLLTGFLPFVVYYLKTGKLI